MLHIMSLAESRVDEHAQSREELRRKHKRIVLALTMCSAMLCTAIASLEPDWADVCILSREERDAATKQWILPASPLFVVSELIIALCLCAHVAAGHVDMSDPFTHLYLSTCTLLAYVAFAGAVVFLKYMLNDTLCNTHPNSVSGHTHFYIFYALALPRLAVEGHKAKCRKHTVFWVMCYCSVLFLSLFQSYRTLAYGFHTVRQIVYGSFVSLVATMLWMFSLDAELSKAAAANGTAAPPLLLQRTGSMALVGSCLAVSVAGWGYLLPSSIAFASAGSYAYMKKSANPLGLL